MKEPQELLDLLREAGVQAFAGVPCSILTSLTNLVTAGPDTGTGTSYLPASVEGEAVAYAAGAWLGGALGAVSMQNSGLGNAVNPLMSLAIPYRIPMLLVVSWRGEPGRPDAHHHLPMGAITPGLLELMGIPAFVVRTDSDTRTLVASAVAEMNERRSPVALIIPAGVYPKSAPTADSNQRTSGHIAHVARFDDGETLTRLQVVKTLARLGDTLKIATTGYMGRTLFGNHHADDQFYMQGSMGFALSIGLGLAEARARERILVLDGDGAVLMRMGSLATVGWRKPENLMHLVLDNGGYRSTGGQPSVAPGVDFAAAALACGYRRAATVAGTDALAPALDWLASEPGPSLVHITISDAEAKDLPRPEFKPREIASYFRRHLETRPVGEPTTQLEGGSQEPLGRRLRRPLARPGRRAILLNPGPATTTQTVKRALIMPDVCPRERAYTDKLADVLARLARVVGDPGECTAIPVIGSGTAAMEAVVGSVVHDDRSLVIIDNGDYGTRLAAIARRLDVPHQVVSCGWGQPIDVDAVAAALAASPGRPSHLAVVHHETSSGLLNPLPPLASLCRTHGLSLIVDAMSSYAAIPIDLQADGIDFLIASANKCIQGMAGLAFVIARNAAIEQARGARPRGYYLDLVAQVDATRGNGQTRFTSPPQIVSALEQALTELERESVAGRRARYDASHAALVAGLEELGFQFLLPPERRSRILLTVLEPDEDWYDFDTMHDYLLARGFTIYPGKPASGRTFRLSVLGAIDESDIRDFLAALREFVDMARRPRRHVGDGRSPSS